MKSWLPKAELDSGTEVLLPLEGVSAGKEKPMGQRHNWISLSIEGLKEVQSELAANPPLSIEQYNELIKRIETYSPEASQVIINSVKFGDVNFIPALVMTLQGIITNMEARYAEELRSMRRVFPSTLKVLRLWKNIKLT